MDAMKVQMLTVAIREDMLPPHPHGLLVISSFLFFLYLHFAFPFRTLLESHQTDKTTPLSQTRVHNDLLMTNRGPMEDAVLTIGTQFSTAAGVRDTGRPREPRGSRGSAVQG